MSSYEWFAISQSIFLYLNPYSSRASNYLKVFSQAFKTFLAIISFTLFICKTYKEIVLLD